MAFLLLINPEEKCCLALPLHWFWGVSIRREAVALID